MEWGGGTKREQSWRLVITAGGEYRRKSIILDLEVEMIRRSSLETPELGVLNLMEGFSVPRIESLEEREETTILMSR